MPAASRLIVALFIPVLLSAPACGGKKRPDPHKAHQERLKSGAYSPMIDTAKTRIGLYTLTSDDASAAADGEAMTRLFGEGVDVLAIVGSSRRAGEALSSAGGASGHGYMAGQRGLGLFSRHPIIAQEGDEPGYPFDGFLIRLPGGEPLWTLTADTALLTEDRVPSAVKVLNRRADSHADGMVVVAVSFRPDSEPVNARFRQALADSGWLPASIPGQSAAIYARYKDSARFQGVAFSAPTEGAAAADLSLKPMAGR